MSSKFFKSFSGKKVGFFGLGKSNSYILENLPEDSLALIRSDAPLPPLPKTRAKIIGTYVGKAAFDNPSEEILILSPSVRRERVEFLPFKERGITFSSDCELFFGAAHAPVFAVSGSDGKSTVTTLVSMLLAERFNKVELIGNVGVPMTSALRSRASAYACELSSFMLSYGRYRVFRGTVTNISENHLDWHRSFSEYVEAKLSVFSRAEETALNADDPISARYFSSLSPWSVSSRITPYPELKRKFRAQVYYTVGEGFIRRNGEPVIDLGCVKRAEPHNISNLLSALSLTDGYVGRERMAEVASRFSGLTHRTEEFLRHGGLSFIDSSIDSTPKRTVTTLQSLGRKVILILGGRGKGLSYEPLREPLAKFAKCAIIIGENGDSIEKAVTGSTQIRRAESVEEAVRLAREIMTEGDTLLLSPASTSYDRFKNFEDRGRIFKETVYNIFG